MLTHPKFAIATTLVWATLVAVLISAGSIYATAQTEALVHTFQSTSKSDGANPSTGLVADSTGALYGATYNGGKYARGPSTSWCRQPPRAVRGR